MRLLAWTLPRSYAPHADHPHISSPRYLFPSPIGRWGWGGGSHFFFVPFCVRSTEFSTFTPAQTVFKSGLL
jgi:hypothetical protein